MKLKNFVLSLLGLTIASVGFADVAKAEGLTDFSFEESGSSLVGLNRFRFLNESDVAGWQTTDSKIEIWGDGFQGVSAGDGEYFAEINAHRSGSIFQEVSDIEAGQTLGFSFMHRARVGTDVMELSITDLGLDNIFGTADDTVLFDKDYSATTENWVFNSSEGEDKILTLGNNLRFAYSAVSTGSGRASVGNFLDAAKFGLASEVLEDAQAVPEPASLFALLGVAAFGAGKLRKRQS